MTCMRNRGACNAQLMKLFEDGAEAYGPRVLTSGSGQRSAAFMHLARILNLPVETALAHTKTGSSWPSEGGRLEAWGGALLITLTVLVLNILARVFFREKVSA